MFSSRQELAQLSPSLYTVLLVQVQQSVKPLSRQKFLSAEDISEQQLFLAFHELVFMSPLAYGELKHVVTRNTQGLYLVIGSTLQ